MKRRTSFAHAAVCSALLAGCAASDAPTTPPPGNTAPYADLAVRKTNVSGVVFDPEALFFSFATWPKNPDDPTEEPPPPALLYGMPTVMRASAWGAKVHLVDATGAVADTSSPAMAPWGQWQTEKGISPDASMVYLMQAESTPEMTIGASDIFPAEAGFLPIPAATYFPTVTLRPLAPTGTQCMIQMATLVGDAGALGALSKTLSTETGTAVTPASLADPSSGRAVALIWVYSPSPVLDLFMYPSGDIAAETNRGSLYALDWAPPTGAPGQSAMGFTAKRNGVSSLGYYALVVPPNVAGPVKVSFVDTITNKPDGRPWSVSPLNMPGLPPGLSFTRLLASSETGPEKEDPFAEEELPPDFSFLCFPP
ncbi:hypothetical protein JGU66_26630 [Myxococcaceae bacterium JPH2]|nr:hypothetical protein [Myxococcaceae bacterium JPH2]